MYEIAIDTSVGLVQGIAEARVAVEGTEIVIKEEGSFPGNWLAELPRHLIEDLRHHGSFEIPNNAYYIMCDWSG
jgi:hypothetical protein